MMQSKYRQQGFLKLFFMFGCAAFVAVVLIKLWPLYVNQFKLKRAVEQTASEGSIDPVAVRAALQRRWDMDDIIIVMPKDVVIERGSNGGGALTFDYEARTHLIYNVDLVLGFQVRAPVKGF